jgi:hypothetical protein
VNPLSDDFIYLMTFTDRDGNMMMFYMCLHCGGTVAAKADGIDEARLGHQRYHAGETPPVLRRQS